MSRGFPLLENSKTKFAVAIRRSNNRVSRVAKKRISLYREKEKETERERERKRKEQVFSSSIMAPSHLVKLCRRDGRRFANSTVRVIKLWNIVSRESYRTRAGSGGYRQFTLLIAKVWTARCRPTPARLGVVVDREHSPLFRTLTYHRLHTGA